MLVATGVRLCSNGPASVDEREGEGQNPAVDETLRIGASACLLGAEVRFDGQHKRNAFLAGPVTLPRHHTRRLGVGPLLGQTYLEPHPKELMLRNHV